MNQKKAGVFLSYVTQFVQIISGVIYTPVMLRILGQGEYGLYQLVYSVVSYLSLLSLGFSGAYLRYYSRYKAEENDEEVARLNGLFLTIYTIMSVACLLCGCFMIQNIGILFGSGLSTAEYSKAKILMTLMIIGMSVSFPTSLFDGYSSAQEKFFAPRVFDLLRVLLNPFITLPVLLLGYGSVGMIIVSTILTLSAFLGKLIYCLHSLKMRFLFNKFKLSLFLDMCSFTFFIFINQIIDQINWNVDKIILARYAGTVATAVYSIGSSLNNYYISFSSTVTGVFGPQVNRIVAESQYNKREDEGNKKLTDIFIRVGRIQFEILAMILSGIILFGRQFIQLWAGNGYEESYYVALLLLIPETIPLIQNVGITIQRAKNMHRARSIVYLCIAIANIGITLVLANLYGPTGAAAGTAISMLAGNCIFMNIYYHKKIKINIIQFWKEIGAIMPSVLLSFFVGYFVLKFFTYLHISWFFSGVVYVLTYVVFLICFGMNEYEKNIFHKLFINRK